MVRINSVVEQAAPRRVSTSSCTEIAGLTAYTFDIFTAPSHKRKPREWMDMKVETVLHHQGRLQEVWSTGKFPCRGTASGQHWMAPDKAACDRMKDTTRDDAIYFFDSVNSVVRMQRTRIRQLYTTKRNSAQAGDACMHTTTR